MWCFSLSFTLFSKLSRPSGTSTTFYFGAALGMTTCLDVQKSIDSGSVSASECNDIRRVTRTTANRCMCRNPSTGAICDAPLSEYEIFQAPPACKANGKSCTMNSNCCSKRCSTGSNGKKKCKKASRLRRDLSSEPVDGQSDKRLKATKHDFLETTGTQRLRHLRS
jgi:hypothetical protein